MALTQFPSERLRSGVASLGAVHGCGIMYDGWVPNPGAQVYPELVQRVSVRPVRGPALGDADGWHVVCGATFRDIHEGVEDPRRVYV